MNAKTNHHPAARQARIRVVVLAALAGGSLAGCTATTQISDSNVETLQFEALVGMLEEQNEKTVLIDVRVPRAFADEHIPGAINIPITELRPGDPRLADAKNIVAYSGDLQDMLSLAAAKTLLRMGYQNIYDYRGGLKAWQANHKRIASGASGGAGASGASGAAAADH